MCCCFVWKPASKPPATVRSLVPASPFYRTKPKNTAADPFSRFRRVSLSLSISFRYINGNLPAQGKLDNRRPNKKRRWWWCRFVGLFPCGLAVRVLPSTALLKGVGVTFAKLTPIRRSAKIAIFEPRPRRTEQQRGKQEKNHNGRLLGEIPTPVGERAKTTAARGASVPPELVRSKLAS